MCKHMHMIQSDNCIQKYVVMYTNQVLHSIAGRGDTNNKEIIYGSKMDELSW